MTVAAQASEAAAIGRAARPIRQPSDLNELVARIGHASYVLIGEASHGTHEFYETRARLTQKLIEEKDFRIVALEADWPDSFRVHRFVTGRGPDTGAEEALRDFRRFPSWMWRNTVVVEFVDWLRHWNSRRKKRADRVGLYGLDLYSMHSSIESVLNYLDKVDAEAARRARRRYACFENFSEEPQAYGMATERLGKEPCEDEVIEQLVELRRKYAQLIRRDGAVAEEEFFSAEQNARLVINAERYYRAMFHGRDETWNLRDAHMFETLEELMEHRRGAGAKAVLWAHNSHLGDARATQMGRRGEWNVGQLVRERHRDSAFSIGFTTFGGTVTAAGDWGAPAECKRVRPGLRGSYEALFHSTKLPSFWLDLREPGEARKLLEAERLERAIGVIYLPESERWSHYFEARLPDQFDAVIHLDETRALQPLDRTSLWDRGEMPETYPSAL